jgi:ribosomal protein S18 acetylase RimI-like enzyme
MTGNQIEAKIMEVLERSEQGAQIEEIATRLGLTRHTIAKYLEVLRAKGEIHFRQVGRTKLWKDISADTKLRPLRAEDIPELLLIEERIEKELGIDEPERMEYLKETASYNIEHEDPMMNLGAEADGKLVGFIIGEMRLWEFGRGERVGWIKVLGVAPEYQGRGIGRKMGERLLDNFKRNGIKRVRTMVDWYAGNLISYFKSLGFDILNMIPLEKELECGKGAR